MGGDLPCSASVPRFTASSDVLAPLREAGLRRAILCRFLGRPHDDPIHARRREASEKCQGTKSRLVGRLQRGGLYDGLIGMLTLMTEGTRREEVEGAFKAVVPPPV